MKKENISKAYEIIKSRIPNLLECFEEKEVKEFIKQIPDDKLETADDEFAMLEDVFDMPIRRCSICGSLFNCGYYLGDSYACSDECRNEYYIKNYSQCNTNEEAYKQYLIECYNLDEEDAKDKSIQEIEEENSGEDVGDYVYYSEWY